MAGDWLKKKVQGQPYDSIGHEVIDENGVFLSIKTN
jgi:hypothetical protein